MLRFLLSTPWLLLRFLLIQTDRDYSRMLIATSQTHSLSGYWEFVELRREEERTGEYDRTNKFNWEDIDDFEEDADPYDNEEESEPDTPPKDRKLPLQQAEELLDLIAGAYDEKALKTAWSQKMKEVHPDVGGTDEQAQAVNKARETVKSFKGWDK
ncbi:MAG: hypothetical protein JKY44_04630 [Flavobacteriaceae bacterium]|nr:hypothetical protein [Flavobacteriaceae bacterium]